MRKLILVTALLAGVSNAHAQQFIYGHLSNGTPFHAYYAGPYGTGFGAGFANGLANARGKDDSDNGPALGAYIPGVITGSDRQLQFEVQVSMNGGGVRAFDPIKKEHFSGTYVVKSRALFVAQTGISLIGDHGSRISCDVTMHAGDIPTGSGDCVDRKAGKYHLQF
jgi:hypothetical protein